MFRGIPLYEHEFLLTERKLVNAGKKYARLVFYERPGDVNRLIRRQVHINGVLPPIGELVKRGLWTISFYFMAGKIFELSRKHLKLLVTKFTNGVE